jgi:hypothetical protein
MVDVCAISVTCPLTSPFSCETKGQVDIDSLLSRNTTATDVAQRATGLAPPLT